MILALGFAAPTAVQAQSFEPINTRAAGMGGAFVAAADDASAVYWNPGALASGALFSFLIDRTSSKALGDSPPDSVGGTRSGTLVALSTPPFGLSYYRLRSSWVSPEPRGPRGQRHPNPHHPQHRRHVGPVARRRHRHRRHRPFGPRHRREARSPRPDHWTIALTRRATWLAKASNKFDADVGISAVFGTFRAGLTVRNLVAPSFETAGERTELKLERQGRAGIALSSPLGFMIALDMDLNSVRGPLGQVRDVRLGHGGATSCRGPTGGLACGSTRSATNPADTRHLLRVGGSLAPLSWRCGLTREATVGAETGRRGWGVAARVGF